MTIDWNRPVQTRDGRPVEIITTKGRDHSEPILGYAGYDVSLLAWKISGKHRWDATLDLINVPEERELWLNVYEKGNSLHISREIADQYQSLGRIACVHVKYKVGEGLE